MEAPALAAGPSAPVRAAPGASAELLLPLPRGTQPFTYHWSRAGAALDERFTTSEDAGGVRLSVSAAQTGDSGVYTLQASNAAGSDTSKIRLEVSAEEAPTGEDPPSFLRRLQDLTVKVGSRTRFLVEIISSTECKVTWYRNERRLLEAERVALARDGNFWCADVAAVSVDDAGRWTCTAENAGGRASCSAHLNVLVPKAYKRPEFVEELRALLTEQGTVSLECKVVGVPTPVLRWFKDSREIKAGDVFALTANAEDPTSLGTYTCEAVNCMGRAYSSSKVHVVGRATNEGIARPSSSSMTPEPPPIFTKELEDAHVKVCEHLTLGCHIVVPPWPRSVVWYNKEGKVKPGERYHVLEDGVGGYLLEILSAEWADEGEWKCVATSAGGRVGITTCYVAMDVPKNYRKPRFMENLQAVLTEEGLVSFECKVVGFPTPVLSWFKDGQELKPGDVYQLTGTNSLGSYCCIARNCMGQASSSAELTVEDIQNQLNEEEKLQLFSKNQAPKFLQGLKSVEAKIDEPFRFTIKVAIPPEPSVLWYRDDQPVDESTRCHLEKEEKGLFNLDVQNLEFLDQAEWKCVAMNDFGHSVTSCFLKLIIPRHYKKPRFLENLQAILSDEGAVNLECKVIGVPQPILKWYKDGEELKPGDIHRIISGQDGTCCLGTYTCEAQNCMGIAASSASLLGFDDSMKTKPKAKEEQPLQRNLSLSTIHEERTSQMYDTPVGDITLDDKGEISFSFDGKEVSVSLYETPDLTEEEALQIVEMYADQLSENVTEHNVVELPPLRFVKETSTSGNLLMEAIIIDVSPDYFATPEEDLRTEADVEDLSIADENGIPQLSLDQDIDIGGEDYLEKTMALLSEERSDFAAKSSRRKSDSQRSADDFFSLSRDQSLSEEKRDDDTHVSESELQSFASARSSAKVKSKSSKKSGEEGQESSEPTKTILMKEELVSKSSKKEPTKQPDQELEVPVIKPKRERRTSRGSRKSSTSSEKSIDKSKELLRLKADSELPLIKPSMSDEEFKNTMNNISTCLTKVINDVQLIERDIILKSELMSSVATASRSLEIISSLITPLSEIHSIADAAKESVSESLEVTSTIFNSIPQSLKALQQSLTIIEKCIDMESDNKTLVKKTCVAFIETCGTDVQKVITDIASIMTKNYIKTEDKIIKEIDFVASEMTTAIKFSADTIKARNLLTEASEIKPEKPTLETKHLRDTQKAVFELKSPLSSLLRIVESAECGNTTDLYKIKHSEVIMNDMSASIQDLQTALEQIESLSVKESSSTLHKYNTEIIETVMDSILKLRGSFEQLSTEPNTEEDKVVLMETLSSLKENLTEIAHKIETIDKNVGQFDILQSENKLDVLQKMAQILIALENNLPRLETMPIVKSHMDTFHKNLTKILEKVIESNDATKYQTMMEICDTVNIINSSIKNLDSENVLPLASLSNTLKIIQTGLVKNIFEAELNCSIMNNISDVLVGIQEAINKSEEISLQIDSEYIQDFSTQIIDEAKVSIILEHIDQTIAAVNTIKTIESTEELKLALAPALKNICPILEDLRRSVASVRPSPVEQDELISEIPDASFALNIATPLCELNQNIIVLNQWIIENINYIKENNEIITAIAVPLHELHTTLEILQQDVISQYGDDLTPYEVSVNMASVVQNLQSCIVMIHEQAGIEGAEEMSTLEDISGIKTSADTIPSDRLVLPTAEETTVEQSFVPFIQEIATTATAQTLQTLNEHIMVLQTPEIIEALDTLSEISDYSGLKSVIVGLGDLHAGIEGILHPVPIEGSIDLEDTTNIYRLAAIAEPMQEIQQCLSVLDTSNIPVYENLLDLPSEKIHSVFKGISELKNSLEQCMCAVLPAMEIASNTIEISNKVSSLREVCEQLREIFETSKDAPSEIALPTEVRNLEIVLNNLIDATDVSKDIKIDQVKCITEELYLKVQGVQEDIIQFTAQSPEQNLQEAKLIQMVSEVETNIAALEQYDFIDLSRTSDITTCISPQIAVEIDSESLDQINDIAENAVNVLQDSYQEIPIADLMIVEDFYKTCKNEFTILRCLITKATTHKKIIRLLQEFNSLQTLINSFTTKRLELRLSDDVNESLTNFLIHADESLRNARNSLIKVVDSQSEMLIKNPITQLESIRKLDYTMESIKNTVIATVIKTLQEVSEISNRLGNNLQCELIEELTQPNQIPRQNQEEIALIVKMEDLAMIVDVQSECIYLDDSTQKVLEKLTTCINKHHNYKDASGTGKTLIILKCLAECATIVQEGVSEKRISINEPTKIRGNENSLKEVLAEMLQPLQTLQTQLINIRDQVLSGAEEESISIDITTTESIMQTMTELHQDIVQQIELDKSSLHNEDIYLIKKVDEEIHIIQDNIKSMENVQVVQAVKEITKPIEEIEKSLLSVISAEQDTLEKGILPREISDDLIHHIDQYIELVEIIEEISVVTEIENVKETFDIARELRDCIAASENNQDKESVSNSRAKQTILAYKLQTVLSALHAQVLDSDQELSPTLNVNAMQQVAHVIAQLQANLLAVTGIQTSVQVPAPLTKTSRPIEEQQLLFATASESVGAIDKETDEVTVISEMLETVITVPPEAVEEVVRLEYKSSDSITSTNLTQNLGGIQSSEIFSIEQAQDFKEPNLVEIVSPDITTATEVTVEMIEVDEIPHEFKEKPVKDVAPTTAQENLLLHISEYVSEEVIEVLNEVSSIVNVEEIKQSINIAKELCECITAFDTDTKEETVVEMKDLHEKKTKLTQDLETKLSTLSEQTLEQLHELLPLVKKATIEKVVTVVENLKADLTVVKNSQQEILQCAVQDQQEVMMKLETAQVLKANAAESSKQAKIFGEETEKAGVTMTQTIAGDSIKIIPLESTSIAAVASATTSAGSVKSSEILSETTAVVLDIEVTKLDELTSEKYKTIETKAEISAENTVTILQEETKYAMPSSNEADINILDEPLLAETVDLTQQFASEKELSKPEMMRQDDYLLRTTQNTATAAAEVIEDPDKVTVPEISEQMLALEATSPDSSEAKVKDVEEASPSGLISKDELCIESQVVISDLSATSTPETASVSQSMEASAADKCIPPVAQATEQSAELVAETTAETLIHNINSFLSDDVLHAVLVCKQTVNVEEFNEAVQKAKELQQFLITEQINTTDEFKNKLHDDFEQANLTRKLQQTLISVQNQLSENVLETLPNLSFELHSVANVILELADTLAVALSLETTNVIAKLDTIKDELNVTQQTEDIIIEDNHENKTHENKQVSFNQDIKSKEISKDPSLLEAPDEFLDCSSETESYKTTGFSSQQTSLATKVLETDLIETTKPFEEFFDSPTLADELTSAELLATEIEEVFILEHPNNVEIYDETSDSANIGLSDTLPSAVTFETNITETTGTTDRNTCDFNSEMLIMHPEVETFSSEVAESSQIIVKENTKPREIADQQNFTFGHDAEQVLNQDAVNNCNALQITNQECPSLVTHTIVETKTADPIENIIGSPKLADAQHSDEFNTNKVANDFENSSKNITDGELHVSLSVSDSVASGITDEVNATDKCPTDDIIAVSSKLEETLLAVVINDKGNVKDAAANPQCQTVCHDTDLALTQDSVMIENKLTTLLPVGFNMSNQNENLFETPENNLNQTEKPSETILANLLVLPSAGLIGTETVETTTLEDTQQFEKEKDFTESATVDVSSLLTSAVTSEASEIMKDEGSTSLLVAVDTEVEIPLLDVANTGKPIHENTTTFQKNDTQKSFAVCHNTETAMVQDPIDNVLAVTTQPSIVELPTVQIAHETISEKSETKVAIMPDMNEQHVQTNASEQIVLKSAESQNHKIVQTDKSAQSLEPNLNNDHIVASIGCLNENEIINEPDDKDNLSTQETLFAQEQQLGQLDEVLKQTDDKIEEQPDVVKLETSINLHEIKAVNDLVQSLNERSSLIQHIDAFINDEVTEIVNEISNITNIETLKESLALAKKLRESVAVTDYSAAAEEISCMNKNNISEHANIAQELQDALSAWHAQALDNAAFISPIISLDAFQKVSEIISHLQENLATAFVSDGAEKNEIVEIGDIVEIEEQNSMAQLETLLQDVNMKINLSTAESTTNADDSESLNDTLDEVQTVIIKLKREYDGAANDTLNETLDDLECSVRSVQLQINEESPPELLTEACATLQLLVDNMNATQHMQGTQALLKSDKKENILEKCSIETEETVNLLDTASKLDITGSSNLTSIVSSLKNIRDNMKSLRESFLVDADTVIENGVNIVQCLNEVEENIFSLEREVDLTGNITADTRDSIITAVHSVYGSISNMRSTISSVQKRFMFENYGRPSESLLHSIKNLAIISSSDDEENKPSWKRLSKSLRKVLNHFEDIKFYINLDKTARLPSDAAFTKIILQELKNNILSVLIPRAMLLDANVLLKVKKSLKCVEINLKNIESDSSLQVKNKIPMFKDISTEILTTSILIKNHFEKSEEPTKISEPLDANIIMKGESSDTNQDLQKVADTIEKQLKEFPVAVSEVVIESSSKLNDEISVTDIIVKPTEEIVPATSSLVMDEVAKSSVKYVTESEILHPVEKQALIRETTSSSSEIIEEVSSGIIYPSVDVEKTISLSSDQNLAETVSTSVDFGTLKQAETFQAAIDTGDTSSLTLQASTSKEYDHKIEEFTESIQTDSEQKVVDSSLVTAEIESTTEPNLEIQQAKVTSIQEECLITKTQVTQDEKTVQHKNEEEEIPKEDTKVNETELLQKHTEKTHTVERDAESYTVEHEPNLTVKNDTNKEAQDEIKSLLDEEVKEPIEKQECEKIIKVLFSEEQNLAVESGNMQQEIEQESLDKRLDRVTGRSTEKINEEFTKSELENKEQPLFQDTDIKASTSKEKAYSKQKLTECEETRASTEIEEVEKDEQEAELERMEEARIKQEIDDVKPDQKQDQKSILIEETHAKEEIYDAQVMNVTYKEKEIIDLKQKEEEEKTKANQEADEEARAKIEKDDIEKVKQETELKEKQEAHVLKEKAEAEQIKPEKYKAEKDKLEAELKEKEEETCAKADADVKQKEQEAHVKKEKAKEAKNENEETDKIEPEADTKQKAEVDNKFEQKIEDALAVKEKPEDELKQKEKRAGRDKKENHELQEKQEIAEAEKATQEEVDSIEIKKEAESNPTKEDTRQKNEETAKAKQEGESKQKDEEETRATNDKEEAETAKLVPELKHKEKIRAKQENENAEMAMQEAKLEQKEEEETRIKKEKANIAKNEEEEADKAKQEAGAKQNHEQCDKKDKEEAEKAKQDAELKHKEESCTEKDKAEAELKQTEQNEELAKKEKAEVATKEKVEADRAKQEAEAKQKEDEKRDKKQKKEAEKAKQEAELKLKEEARAEKDKAEAELKQTEQKEELAKEEKAEIAKKEKEEADKAKQEAEAKQNEDEKRDKKQKEKAEKAKEEAEAKLNEEARAEKEKGEADRAKQEAEAKQREEENRNRKQKEEAEKAEREAELKLKEEARAENDKAETELKQTEQNEEIAKKEKAEIAKKDKEEADRAKLEAEAKQKEEEKRDKKHKEEAEKDKQEAEAKQREEELVIKEQAEIAKNEKEEADNAKQESEAKQREVEKRNKKQKKEAEKAKEEAEAKQKEEARAEKEKAEAELKQTEQRKAKIAKKDKEEADRAKLEAEAKQKEEEKRDKKHKEEAEKVKQEAELKLKEEALAEKDKAEAELKQTEQNEEHAKKEKAEIAKKEKEKADRANQEAEAKQKEDEKRDKKQKEEAEKTKREAELKLKEEARAEKERAEAELKQTEQKEELAKKEKAEIAKKEKEKADRANQEAEAKQKEDEKRDKEEKKKAEKAKRDAELKLKEEARAEKDKAEAELKQTEQKEELAKKEKAEVAKKEKEEADRAKLEAEEKLKDEKKRDKKHKKEAEKAKQEAEAKQKEEELVIKEQAKIAKKEKEEADKAKQEAEAKQKDDENKKQKEEAEKTKREAEIKQKEEARAEKERAEVELKQTEQKEELAKKEKTEIAKKEKEKADRANQEAEAKQKEDEKREKKQKEEAEKTKREAELKLKEEARAEKERAEAELKQTEQKEELAKKEKAEIAKKEKEKADRANQEAEAKQKEDEKRDKKQKEEAEKAKRDAELKLKEEARAEKDKVEAELKQTEQKKELAKKENAEIAKKEKEEVDKAKQEAEAKQKEDEKRDKKQKEKAEKAKREAELKLKEEACAKKDKAEAELRQTEQKEELAKKEKAEIAKKEKEEADRANQEAEAKQKEDEKRDKKQKEEAEKTKREAELNKKEEACVEKGTVEAELKQKDELAKNERAAIAKKEEKEEADRAKQEAKAKQIEEARAEKEKAEAEFRQTEQKEELAKKEKTKKAKEEKEEAESKLKEEEKRDRKQKEEAEKAKEEAEAKQKEEEKLDKKQKKEAEKAKREAKLKQKEEACVEKSKAETEQKEELAKKGKAELAKNEKEEADMTRQEAEAKQKQEDKRIKKQKEEEEKAMEETDLIQKQDRTKHDKDIAEKQNYEEESRQKKKNYEPGLFNKEEKVKERNTRKDEDDQKIRMTQSENKETSHDAKDFVKKNNVDDISKKSTKYTERLDKSERRDDELHIYKQDSERQAKKENGDVNYMSKHEQHYIREYQYEPSQRGHKLEAKEKPRFVDHNHRDYTMEFARPSGYRERPFVIEKTDSPPSHDYLGRNAIYKAQTLILDSQLRASTPLCLDPSSSRTSEPTERRSEIRQRSKAHSEARTITSDKRTGASRDSKRKPVFSTYLTDRTAVEGSRVKLTCSVLSSSDPTVTWHKNGVLLDNKLKYRTKYMDGLITLEVLNAVPSDSAEYSCTIQNENGSVNSSASLKVYPSFEASPIPPTFTRSIRDTYHLAENELVLECRIRGQPLPTITWLKDEKSISTNSRCQAYYLADGVCRLAIEHPTLEDSGKYTCKAENSVWSDQITHVVNFTGKESRLGPNIATIEKSRFNRQALESRRPHFTNVLSDYKVATGGTIGLQVEIRGAPTRVEWLREGCSVTEVYRNAKTFVEQGLYTLALSDVTEKETGMYTCRAWSSQCHVDMNAAITVVQPNELDGKPAIIVGRPEKDILISVGEDVNISFRVQGEPKPKVVFMKGIRDITTNQRVCKMTSDDYVKFTLKRSVVSDAGTYCILARNAYGCDRAFVTVVVRQRASSDNLISDWTYPVDDSTLTVADRKYKSVPERISGEPCVLEGGNNWISLGWSKPEPGPSAPVLAYKVESWLLGTEGGARWVELGITPLTSFDAFNLKQGEEYHFRVTPRNRYGWGESVQTSSSTGVGLAGERPEFSESLSGQLKVLVGETANLSCCIKGSPAPEVVWMKNGHEIEDEDRRLSSSFNGFNCNLTIKDINVEDEARYSCEATNVHGRASTYARLAVVTDRSIWEADAKLKRERSADVDGDYPPQFTMRLRDRRVQATYPVRLTCQVIGSPDPRITWFKDGEEVRPDNRRSHFQDEHFHTLEIAPTTLEDGGVYEAMARNSSGAVSCHCSLVVDKGIRAYVAPEFCCGLEPLYRLTDGEELRISAVVEAYPSVGVTWYRDGVRLRPSRRAIMTLDRDGQIELALAAVTSRDAGVYSCTASNEVGRASTSGKVEVIGSHVTRTPPIFISPDEPYSKEPMFIRKPRSSEAREGDTVIIACEVVGDPKPDVFWLRDFLKPDYYRDSSHFKRMGAGPEYRFEIPHAKLDYTGAYSVVARNQHGEAKAVISLQILAKDPASSDEAHNVRYGRVEVLPRFSKELTDLLSCDGDAVEFECHVSGHPEPHVRWFHYHELIRDCPDFETSFDEDTARLKIKQVTAEDEGTYICEAANNLGKTTSSACLVVYPPGEPNTLSQRLHRPPAFLSAASTPRSTPRSTPARSVSRTPGPETWRVCSPARTLAPSFYTYPFNKVAEEGDSVTLQCAIKGNPAPWATWDKDGVIITPSSRITIKEKDDVLRVLEIDQVSVDDVGVYRITIENEFGRQEASARIEVITQKGKFYAGVRAVSPSPRKSLSYRSRRPSTPRQD